MQANGVISLRPALGIWRTLRDFTGADADALYGCVDWFLYHEDATARDAPARTAEPAPPSDALPAGAEARPGG